MVECVHDRRDSLNTHAAKYDLLRPAAPARPTSVRVEGVIVVITNLTQPNLPPAHNHCHRRSTLYRRRPATPAAPAAAATGAAATATATTAGGAGGCRVSMEYDLQLGHAPGDHVVGYVLGASPEQVGFGRWQAGDDALSCRGRERAQARELGATGLGGEQRMPVQLVKSSSARWEKTGRAIRSPGSAPPSGQVSSDSRVTRTNKSGAAEPRALDADPATGALVSVACVVVGTFFSTPTLSTAAERALKLAMNGIYTTASSWPQAHSSATRRLMCSATARLAPSGVAHHHAAREPRVCSRSSHLSDSDTEQQ